MTPFRKLVSYFKPYKRTLIIGTVCVFLTNVFKLVTPDFVRRATDAISEQGAGVSLFRYGGLIVLATLVQGVFLFTQRRMLINMSRHVEFDMRSEFYEHLQRLPFEFYQTHRTGDLMARATNDLSAVRMIAGPALMYSLNTVFAMALLVPLMASISWRLTLLAFMSMPLVATATHYFSRRIHDRFEQVQEYFGTVSNRAQEALAGVRVIRAYTQERAEMERFREVNRGSVSRNLSLIKLSGIFHPILQFFIGLGFVAVLWYGGALVIRERLAPGSGISIGQFVQFTLYLGYLIWPMIAFGWVINIFQRGIASMGRMNQILMVEPAIRDTEETQAISKIDGEIEFRHLTFNYDQTGEASLKDIDLRIAPG